MPRKVRKLDETLAQGQQTEMTPTAPPPRNSTMFGGSAGLVAPDPRLGSQGPRPPAQGRIQLPAMGSWEGGRRGPGMAGRGGGRMR